MRPPSAAGDTALTDAIRDNFGKFRGRVEVDLLDRSDWASVTFTGAQHRLRVRLDGEGAAGAAADFLAAMGERELSMPGHIVADLALLAQERDGRGAYVALDLEVLTIEDRWPLSLAGERNA